MLFSRGLPKDKEKSKAIFGFGGKNGAEIKTLAITTPQNSSIGAGSFGEPAQDDDTLIEVDKDIPVGNIINFGDYSILKKFEESFAVIQINSNTILLIVAIDAAGTHPQFELCRRLAEVSLRVTKIRKAAREVVKMIHQRSNAANDASAGQPDSQIETIAWALIDQAIELGTSDIHIETRSTHAQVFFRIFGERIEQPNISFETATALCNVLYGFHADSSSKETGWSPEKVLDTSIARRTASGKSFQLRFSSGPIFPAEGKNFHCVIRLLGMDASSKNLEKVGYTDAQIAVIEEMLVGAQGMVLLVGPTNSGKSTSMQAMIRRIFDRRGKNIKIITVEKPVEYMIPGACQMGVPEKRKALEGSDGNIYTTFLKGTLRQDPDVVMVGEIRATDEADATKDLVLAGRKLLTTLHVYEVVAVFARLEELGIPKSVLLMDGFISGVVYQRLVPILCKSCSVPVQDGMNSGFIHKSIYERVMRLPNLDEADVRVRDPHGCAQCNYLGVVGRTPCAELLQPDSTFLQYLREGREADARAYWHSNPRLNVQGLGVTAVAHAISKMFTGLIDPTDIENQIGPLVVRDTVERISTPHVEKTRLTRSGEPDSSEMRLRR